MAMEDGSMQDSETPTQMTSNESRWVLEDRLRYKKIHRQEDLKLLRALWPSPTSASTITRFDETSPAIRKKYSKVEKAHQSYWSSQLASAVAEHEGERKAKIKIIEETDKLLKSMKVLLPKVDGKMVVDVPECVLSGKSQDRLLGTLEGIALTWFWVLYNRVTAKLGLGDYNGCIKIVDELLAIFPPLSDSRAIPHPQEVNFLFYGARAKCELGGPADLKGSLDEFRCCGAAARLLMYNRELEVPDDIKYICQSVVGSVVRSAVTLKIQTQAQRPFFSVDELNSYEKELGFGIYARTEYKCGMCGVLRDKAWLTLCTGCKRQWYCGRQCQVKAWPDHKCNCKAKWRQTASVSMCRMIHETLKAEVKKGGGVFSPSSGALSFDKAMYSIDPDINKAMYCIDPDTSELFDGWIDRTYSCEN